MDEQQVAWIATPYRAPVVDPGGADLGTTESLLGDEKADIFHGIAVKLKEGGNLVEIPAEKIVRITTQRVYTAVSADQVGGLQPYRQETWFHLGWGGLFRKRPEWKEL